MRRSVTAIFAAVALVLSLPLGASAAPGTATGHKWGTSCGPIEPRPWVQGETQGDTYIKGPGSSTPIYYWNPTKRSRNVSGTLTGGQWSVQGLGHIYITQTFGYCGT